MSEKKISFSVSFFIPEAGQDKESLDALRAWLRFQDEEWIVFFVGPRFIELYADCFFSSGYTFQGNPLELTHITRLQMEIKPILLKILEGNFKPAEQFIERCAGNMRRLVVRASSSDPLSRPIGHIPDSVLPLKYHFVVVPPDNERDFVALVADRLGSFLVSGAWQKLKRCEECKSPFLFIREDQRFCNAQCRSRAKEKRDERRRKKKIWMREYRDHKRSVDTG
jgi:hypothetical protein